MAINVSIIKSPSGVTPKQSNMTFGDDGGTLGRGDANSWVLDDPDRFLSSKHCQLKVEGGQLLLTDLSTNGTFVNGSPEPLGKGGKTPVKDGDTFEIGDYLFKVSMSAGAAAPAADPFASAPAADPFAGQPDPFAASAPKAADPFAGEPDPFASTPAADPFTAKPAASSDPFGAEPDPFGAGNGIPGGSLNISGKPEELDPLAMLDKSQGGIPDGSATSGASTDPFGSPAGQQIPDDPFGQDPFANPAGNVSGGTADPFASNSNSYGDGANPMNQSVDWPEAKQQNLIPDDWEDDLMGGAPRQPSAPSQPSGVDPFGQPAQQTPDPFANDAGSDPFKGFDPAGHGNIPKSEPLTTPPEISTPKPTKPPARSTIDPTPEGQVPPRPDALLSERAPESVDPFQSKPPQPAAQVAQPEAPAARPQAKPKSTATGNTNAQAALLEGMGLGDKHFSEEEMLELHALIGELMPVIIEGMMQVLRSRASIKNEFRMNVTTIQPVENNPLKFSANANEAIENMFLRKSAAYKQPVEAFSEGFYGIGEHQVAIIAGIRAAFKSMMDRFNPEKLEKQFEKQNKGVGLPGMTKARYWNNYSEYYQGFVDNMENTFQYLFGDEFVQAYEDQLRTLAAERNRNKKNGL